MNGESEISASQIESAYQSLKKDAAAGGYYINPDVPFARELVKGILVNQKRYGYGNCPCRLASGSLEEDQDMVCPCDYRDADVLEFGSCY
ncbi:MAG TPA: ferredoxin-thioredoxin reductase catalytic domain-containing protein [Dehalococcoidales bacterium]|nr:ferredoxin-thioredoxin reductase catalytic domain-containing protein [Dehalococcoidales bacterium]